ncbi:LysR family transcriptional regulator [Pseudomonas syringae]|uniref:Transcriptional regulator, LysR family n=1 Tax=Pseudomonas syringae pv. syringae (strain B728a) TaxID=205918 RepID=Q4ZR78_PSEU2|nr:LysR family transcriptional regulator [Pseudomonas syringae]AAY38344.1 transcriptional regulator, LysR family [Pseudomonas syringae pv. syringae B728a]PBP70508.1 LysR family transcriptional regulator [Pseudomonas syringae]PYD11290.1 LysR family transcriptional regulator [Pseudomonas syringae pv. syringae]
MRINLRQLQIFCAITRCGSTTSAGSALALSQSATSAALNELESALGTRLFDRVGKRLVLNDSGQALLPRAMKMLENAQQIEDSFLLPDAALNARLRIGSSSTIGNYVVPQIVGALRGSTPQLRIDVDIGNSALIARKVAQFEIDMGLIEAPCHLPELIAEPWLVDEMVIVAGRAHPLAGEEHVSLGELQSAEWLLREQGSGTREEVEHLLLRHLHDLQDMRQVGSSEAIMRTLAQGIGISCLSRRVVADLLASGQLRTLASPLPPLNRRFFMIRHRDKFISPSLERFREACRQAADQADTLRHGLSHNASPTSSSAP